MHKHTVLFTAILLTTHIASAGESQWSLDVTGIHNTRDIKKDAPSLYTYVPTRYGYAPVLTQGGVNDGNVESVTGIVTVGRSVAQFGGNRIRSHLSVIGNYTDERTVDINNQLQGDDSKSIQAAEMGFEITEISEEDKSSTTFGLALSHDIPTSQNRVNLNSGFSKQYDAIKIGLSGNLSLDTDEIATKEITSDTNYAGNIFTLNPSVTFIPNDKTQLTGGVQMSWQQADVQNGKEISIRRADSSLVLGTSYQMDRKNSLYTGVTVGSATSLGSTVTAGWSHNF